MKNQLEQTQSILYLGYIFLVILGIVNETLFYGQFDINILEYADILDVLLSPISRLTSNKVLMIISLLTVLGVIFIPRQLGKLKNKAWFTKLFNIKNPEENLETKLLSVLTVSSVIFFLGFFVGTGLGKGERLQKRMNEKTIEYNDKVLFLDGQTLNVEIVGKNSSYIFYVLEGEDNIQISPINGTVKTLTIQP
ncbi:hypothetical protein [Flammeovirga sp. SubArs3]|uniref:hypothetical protein n=1 Tax=Flammeovirga sp. SubArs3 TaxID=2995316 RepID=UPI00248CF761|nr:hypothetical protein [Flammeovirga sp. SubArs3]